MHNRAIDFINQVRRLVYLNLKTFYDKFQSGQLEIIIRNGAFVVNDTTQNPSICHWLSQKNAN